MLSGGDLLSEYGVEDAPVLGGLIELLADPVNLLGGAGLAKLTATRRAAKANNALRAEKLAAGAIPAEYVHPSVSGIRNPHLPPDAAPLKWRGNAMEMLPSVDVGGSQMATDALNEMNPYFYLRAQAPAIDQAKVGGLSLAEYRPASHKISLNANRPAAHAVPHELGHAIDYRTPAASGAPGPGLRQDEDLLSLLGRELSQDLDMMPEQLYDPARDLRIGLNYFTQPREAVAETLSYLASGDNLSGIGRAYMPGLTQYLTAPLEQSVPSRMPLLATLGAYNSARAMQ
jgi:hypothetical protein